MSKVAKVWISKLPHSRLVSVLSVIVSCVCNMLLLYKKEKNKDVVFAQKMTVVQCYHG